MFAKSDSKYCIRLALFVIMILFTADLTYTTFFMHITDLPPNNLLNVTVDLVGSMICVVMYGTILLDHSYGEDTHHFLLLVFFELLILNADATNWMLDGSHEDCIVLTIANIALFVIIIIMAFEMWMLLQSDLNIPRDRQHILSGIIIVAAAIGILNTCLDPLTHWIFYIDDAGYYVRGNYILLSNLPVMTMVIVTVSTALIYGTNLRRKITVLVYEFAPMAAMILQYYNYGYSYLYISLILTLLMIYGNYYVSRGTDILKINNELTEERFAVMYSQIQPHFLYNSLTSIMNIKGNPPETLDAISDFAKYLRGNLDTLSVKHPIPLQKELEHVEIYVNLEQLRFKDKLSVEYDIQDRKFFVPALCMQMLVENAIKHGITMKEGGGKVVIRTRRDEDYHYIEVEDNGKGFDANQPRDQDSTHVGLDNLRNRLNYQLKGELLIESTVDVGTKAVIRIPIPKDH